MLRRAFLILALMSAACGGNSTPVPTTPTPVIPACQANNTASVSFGNRSANTTQDIFWDGLRVATITPGQNSNPITAAAGVAHNMQFRITNTTLLACAVSAPIPVQCDTPLYTCAFP